MAARLLTLTLPHLSSQALAAPPLVPQPAAIPGSGVKARNVFSLQPSRVIMASPAAVHLPPSACVSCPRSQVTAGATTMRSASAQYRLACGQYVLQRPPAWLLPSCLQPEPSGACPWGSSLQPSLVIMAAYPVVLPHLCSQYGVTCWPCLTSQPQASGTCPRCFRLQSSLVIMAL